jgi:hypothetical protein
MKSQSLGTYGFDEIPSSLLRASMTALPSKSAFGYFLPFAAFSDAHEMR